METDDKAKCDCDDLLDLRKSLTHDEDFVRQLRNVCGICENATAESNAIIKDIITLVQENQTTVDEYLERACNKTGAEMATPLPKTSVKVCFNF